MRRLEVGIAIVIVLVVVALFFVFGNPLGLMSNPSSDTNANLGDTTSTNNPANSAPSENSTASSSLVVQDQTVGTGATAQPGETLIVNYTGKLEDGTVFDTSVGKPAAQTCPAGTQEGFCFTLGAGQVIQGWDQGLVGMKVGGTRTLIIPPSMGYGSQAVGPIPANSTLVFEVQLLSIASSTSAQ